VDGPLDARSTVAEPDLRAFKRIGVVIPEDAELGALALDPHLVVLVPLDRLRWSANIAELVTIEWLAADGRR